MQGLEKKSDGEYYHIKKNMRFKELNTDYNLINESRRIKKIYSNYDY